MNSFEKLISASIAGTTDVETTKRLYRNRLLEVQSRINSQNAVVTNLEAELSNLELLAKAERSVALLNIEDDNYVTNAVNQVRAIAAKNANSDAEIKKAKEKVEAAKSEVAMLKDLAEALEAAPGLIDEAVAAKAAKA